MSNANLKSQIKKRSRSVCPVRKFGIARHQTMLAMFQAILQDIQNINPLYRSVDSARDLKTITIRLKEEGLGFISATLPNLMSELFAHSVGKEASYTGWKKQSGAEYPAFLGRLFAEVYNEGPYSAISFAHIYQICVLFKKLNGPFKKEVLRETTRSFIEDDAKLGLIDFQSDVVKPILDKSRELIETVFEDIELSPSTLMPKPGPGATNTPVEHHLRFRPHRLFTSLDEEFGYLDWFYSHAWDPFEDARRYMGLPEFEEPTSRYKAVHKYLGKPRGICIEENEMQFFQQAAKALLYGWIEWHPATRGRVNFTQQDVNRNLALTASVDNKWTTLDMRSASNMVARELVFRQFWNTKLFTLLDALSTRVITFADDAPMYANMFAPMGSGVCFPIMAIVHWALVRSIISLSSLEDSSNLAKQVYVYGDDIIFPAQATEAVYTYLPYFGMKINTDKSFSCGPFRESCGIHAYNGVDVTPVYVNHVTSFNQSRNDTTTLLSLIAKESLFFNKGFLNTSQCIQKLVTKHYWSLPFVGEASSVVGFIRPGRTDYNHVTKWARRMRYDENTQTLEFSLQVITPRGEDKVAFPESDGYLRSLVSSKPLCYERLMPIVTKSSPLVWAGGIDELTIRRQWVSETAI